MPYFVLRVSSPTLDVEACLACLPQLRREDCYRKGEIGVRKRVHAESGFTLSVADDGDAVAAISTAQRRLVAMAPQLADFIREGATAELDCALWTKAAKLYTAITFAAPFLASLGSLGVRLCVTAYQPTEEDDDEPEQPEPGEGAAPGTT